MLRNVPKAAIVRVRSRVPYLRYDLPVYGSLPNAFSHLHLGSDSAARRSACGGPARHPRAWPGFSVLLVVQSEAVGE